MLLKRLLAFALLSLLTLQTALAETFDHSQWDSLLKAHVSTINDGKATTVDYHGMARDRNRLQQYEKALSAVAQDQFDQWPKEDQLAFLINAYNAWTVALILTAWPDLGSIKDLGGLFSSPWSKEFIPLLGKTRSLDDVEHGLIRGSDRYQDPRIHFAVNCASIGCPALRPEAFRGDILDRQLDEQTRLFLADRSRNRLEGDTLKLSAIFKWYREDFEKGWMKVNTLEDFLMAYADALSLPPATIKKVQAKAIDIDYLDYDWRLNEKR